VLLHRILPILWPSRCAGCNALVPEGTGFCCECALSLVPVGPSCPGCAMPEEGGRLCGGCRRRSFPFTQAFAAFVYGGSLTQAILRFKHCGHRDLARPLAAYLAPILCAAAAQGLDVICPVPLHPRRLRQRGYNQVLELLRVAGRGMLRERRIHIICNALSRTIDTPTLGHQSPEHGARVEEFVSRAFARSLDHELARRSQRVDRLPVRRENRALQVDHAPRGQRDDDRRHAPSTGGAGLPGATGAAAAKGVPSGSRPAATRANRSPRPPGLRPR